MPMNSWVTAWRQAGTMRGACRTAVPTPGMVAVNGDRLGENADRAAQPRRLQAAWLIHELGGANEGRGLNAQYCARDLQKCLVQRRQ